MPKAATGTAIGLAMLCLACTAESPGATAVPSGFLGEVSQLEQGAPGQAQLVYIHPEASFARYDKVWIERVEAWTGGRPDASAERRDLAVEFGAALRSELERSFELVDGAAPGTLRIRSALTGVSASGTSIELEVLDAVTGERLVAVVDAQESTSPDGPRAAFDDWAAKARARLAALRSFDIEEAAYDAQAGPGE